MGFSHAAIGMYQRRREQAQRDAGWINEPGWHAVKVTGYRTYTGPASVVFNVVDHAGREQEVRVPLDTAALRSNLLSSFLGAALGWERYKCAEPSFGRARAPYYRQTVGQRIMIYVIGDRGRATVLDWAPLPRPTAQERE